MSHAVIFVITKNSALSVQNATLLSQLLATTTQPVRPTTVVPATVDKMRRFLQDPNVGAVSPMISTAEHKLLAAFDNDGNDLLYELCTEANKSQEISQSLEDAKILIMPIASIVREFCKSDGATKIWVQKPLMGSYDAKLAQRLADDGLQICTIDPEIEKFADIAAVRAAALYDLDQEAHKEVAKFWRILSPEFERTGVQKALINHCLSALILQRDKNDHMPQAIGLSSLYMQAILTWATGTY